MLKHRRIPVGRVSALLLGAAVVFVSILAQLGVGPVYLFRQFELREAMERRILKGLSDEALCVLRFSETEFEEVALYDGGQELELGDVMYDIVSLEHSAGGVVVKAVRDGDETRLNAELDRMAHQHLAADQRGKRQRMSIVSAWAPYCEGFACIAFAPRPLAKRLFSRLPAFEGRDRGPIDPGPPWVS